MPTRIIDMTSLGDVTGSVRVGDKHTLGSVTVLDTGAWGTAVIEVEESIDDATWLAMAPAAEMSLATPSVINKGVYGSLFIRFRTKVNDAGADATATITYHLLG